MSLIDTSYFAGPLTIAQLGQKAVDDSIKDFINLHEPDFLWAALGYEFYQNFLAGLLEDTVDQKWLDILQGVEFTNLSSYKRKWVGLAAGNDVVNIVNNGRDDLFIYAGVTAGFPVSGTTYTDSSLKNWNYQIKIRSIGELNPETEWQKIAGGGAEIIIPGYEVQADEVWIFSFTSRTLNVQAAGTTKLSPIANYVYYQFQENISMQQAGVGVVKSKAENATVIAPAYKMAYAWNEMGKMLLQLWDFLQVNNDTYSGDGYLYSEINRFKFRPVNTLGI